MMFDDLQEAWVNWKKVDSSLENYETFLGQYFWQIVDQASEGTVLIETRRKIDLLLGPHHVAIIKAHFINLPRK